MVTSFTPNVRRSDSFYMGFYMGNAICGYGYICAMPSAAD